MTFLFDESLAALGASFGLGQPEPRVANSISRLSSGFRVTSAEDLSICLGLSQALQSRLQGYAIALHQTRVALDITEGAGQHLGEIGQIVRAMRELAAKSVNAELGAVARGRLEREFQKLKERIDDVARSRTATGLGSAERPGPAFPVATDATDPSRFGTVSVASLGLSGVQVSSAEPQSAVLAVVAVDAALATVSLARAQLGAMAGRLRLEATATRVARTNLQAVCTPVGDMDWAERTTLAARSQVLCRGRTSVLAQAPHLSSLAQSLVN